MDHRRIEWLFLIIFLLIDIYLGIEILRSPVSLSSIDTTNGSSASIRQEMRADGIDLPSNLSEKTATSYYLAAKNSDYLSDKLSSLTQVNASYSKSQNMITATPRSTVEVKGNKKAILATLKQFKDDERNVPFGKNYSYEESMSSDETYTFVQDSEYGKIYNNSALLTIIVKDHEISSYMISYLGTVKPVRELQSTISPWHAIRSMYTDRELANNSRIIKVKLAYSKLTVVHGSTILLPTWLVWVENKNSKNISLKRVNAFTGQVLATNTTYSINN